MAADVEVIALVLAPCGDAADIFGVLLDDEDGLARLGEAIGGGQPRGTSTDDQGVEFFRKASSRISLSGKQETINKLKRA